MRSAFSSKWIRICRCLAAAWFAVVGLSFHIGAVARCTSPKADPRVRISTPAEGQAFAPGDTVNVTVRSTVALAAGWVAVGVPGAGVLEGQGWDGSTYHAKFVIPPDHMQLGALEITPDVMDAAGHPIEGMCVTIIVRRRDAPISLYPANSLEFLFPIGSKARVYVTGRYTKGIEADLTSSTVGTLYASSDERVVSVDAEGNVESTGLGTAVVTASNGGVSTFVDFVVEDPEKPLPPQELSARVSFTKSPLRLDEAATANLHFPVQAQTITITNTTQLPIIGPLYLTVKDLPSDVRLLNGPNLHAPVLYLNLRPKDGLTIEPGDSVTRLMQYVMPRSAAEPSYTLGLIRSRGEPRKWDPPPPAAGPSPSAIPAFRRSMALQANQCIKTDATDRQATGPAMITNQCPYAVQYTLCYQSMGPDRFAGRGRFDCKKPPTGVLTDGLAAGESRTLPQYERNSNVGFLIIACKGSAGEVTPLLDHGMWGCH